MKRRLFTILLALSLPLFLAVCVLWVWSSVTGEYLAMTYQGRSVGLEMGGGAGALMVSVHFTNLSPAAGESGWGTLRVILQQSSWTPVRPIHTGNVTSWYFGGFSYDCSGFTWGVSRRALVPLWFVGLALGIAPVCLLSRLHKPCRANGLCPSCGYDLRATPERCPECGLVAELRT